jgi:hypothetical protein
MIEHLKLYMDDSSSFDLEGNVLVYKPYGSYLPQKQVLLLQLWDKLGIPHELQSRFEHGPRVIVQERKVHGKVSQDESEIRKHEDTARWKGSR